MTVFFFDQNFPFSFYCAIGVEKSIGQELINERYAVKDYIETRVLSSDANGSSSPISSTKMTNGGNSNPNANYIQSPANDLVAESAVPQTKSNVNYLTGENDKFTAICENTTNENYENIKIDNRNHSNSFIDIERFNGNAAESTTRVDTSKNPISSNRV